MPVSSEDRQSARRVLFLCRKLEIGGAERQLVTLARGLRDSGVDVCIVTFYAGGELEAEVIADAGLEITSMQKAGRWDFLRPMWRLFRIARRFKPEVLHGYLDVANLLCLPLGWFLGAKVVWGIRSGFMEYSNYDWTHRAVYRLGVLASGLPNLILCNSESGRRHHIQCGYRSSRMKVIPNGIDTESFQMDAIARNRLRSQWGLADGDRLIGLVARLDPIKDHATFLLAAAHLLESRTDVVFACVGGGPQDYREALETDSDQLGLTGKVLWLDARIDMPAIYSTLDLSTLCSIGESFPNVIAESMSCGVPCVATDVGDVRSIISDTGLVVPRRDPAALAEAWNALIDRIDSDPCLKDQSRQRIAETYSIDRMVNGVKDEVLGLLAQR